MSAKKIGTTSMYISREARKKFWALSRSCSPPPTIVFPPLRIQAHTPVSLIRCAGGDAGRTVPLWASRAPVAAGNMFAPHDEMPRAVRLYPLPRTTWSVGYARGWGDTVTSSVSEMHYTDRV